MMEWHDSQCSSASLLRTSKSGRAKCIHAYFFSISPSYRSPITIVHSLGKSIDASVSRDEGLGGYLPFAA